MVSGFEVMFLQMLVESRVASSLGDREEIPRAFRAGVSVVAMGGGMMIVVRPEAILVWLVMVSVDVSSVDVTVVVVADKEIVAGSEAGDTGGKGLVVGVMMVLVDCGSEASVEVGGTGCVVEISVVNGRVVGGMSVLVETGSE